MSFVTTKTGTYSPTQLRLEYKGFLYILQIMEIQKTLKIIKKNTIQEKGIDLSKNLSPDDRVSLLEDLRQQIYLNIKHEYPGRHQRVLTIIKKNNVDFVIVGGYAVAFHGYIRTTNDMDIFFRNTSENTNNIENALVNFGFTKGSFDLDEFYVPGSIIEWGYHPAPTSHLFPKLPGIPPFLKVLIRQSKTIFHRNFMFPSE
jgi:hypothetical protein